jgi:hypothetical protein
MDSTMQRRQLKRLIETGHYRPEPEQVAQAMLARRGVRELLTGGIAVSSAGRIQPAPASGRQAA